MPPFFTPTQLFAADLCDMLLFACVYAWALLWRHKRLMLSAAVLLSWPAIGRLHLLWHYGLGMIIPLSILALVALALAGPVHDLITRRRVHPAYLWGVAAALLLWPLYAVLAVTGPVHAIVQPWLPAAT